MELMRNLMLVSQLLKISIPALAKQMGVSAATLYRDVKRKDMPLSKFEIMRTELVRLFRAQEANQSIPGVNAILRTILNIQN